MDKSHGQLVFLHGFVHGGRLATLTCIVIFYPFRLDCHFFFSFLFRNKFP
jgi:hypothetical protein